MLASNFKMRNKEKRADVKLKTILVQAVLNYATRSSVQGIPYVVEGNQSIGGRIFWGLVVLIAVSLGIAMYVLILSNVLKSSFGDD